MPLPDNRSNEPFRNPRQPFANGPGLDGKEGVDGSSPSEGSSTRPRLTSGILCRAPLAESPALTEEDDSLRVLLVSILLVQLTGPGILLVVSAAFSRERRPRCLLGRLRLSV